MKSTSIKQLFKLLLLSSVLAIQSYAQAEVKITYYIPDASGSPVAATDEQGEVLWRKHYKPFGEEIEQDAASKNNHIGYTGHVHDRDTGLTYMRARYYDPVVGRFMGMDSAGVNPEDPRTFNRYAYANNNPYKYVDPDGRNAVAIGTLGVVVVVYVALAVDPNREKRINDLQQGVDQLQKGWKSFVENGNDESESDEVSDNSKNEKHGDRGRAKKKAVSQIEELKKKLESASGNEKKKIKQKIKNINDTATKKANGTEHSRGKKI